MVVIKYPGRPSKRSARTSQIVRKRAIVGALRQGGLRMRFQTNTPPDALERIAAAHWYIRNQGRRGYVKAPS